MKTLDYSFSSSLKLYLYNSTFIFITRTQESVLLWTHYVQYLTTTYDPHWTLPYPNPCQTTRSFTVTCLNYVRSETVDSNLINGSVRVFFPSKNKWKRYISMTFTQYRKYPETYEDPVQSLTSSNYTEQYTQRSEDGRVTKVGSQMSKKDKKKGHDFIFRLLPKTNGGIKFPFLESEFNGRIISFGKTLLYFDCIYRTT